MIADLETTRTFLKGIYCRADFLDHSAEANFGVSYPEKAMAIEKFARPLWGMCWDSEVPEDQIEAIRLSIAECCAPSSAYYWGRMEDYSQIAVEILPIALFLHNKKEKTWDRYTVEEQDQIARWFLQINEIRLPENNWLFFKILTNQIFFLLEKTAAPSVFCKAEFDSLERMYLGNGWYSDGMTKQRDYYVAFAFHYYSLIYAKLAQKEDPERCRVFLERANLFAWDYIYWFSEDGSTVPFGRSLIYRFAVNAFWGALVWSGAKLEIPVSVIKGILMRNYRWWEGKQLTQDGKVCLGYAYPNTFITEAYNSPFSPLWCLKSAIILDIPEEDVFWQTYEVPLPQLDAIRIQREAGAVVCRHEESVMLFPADQKSQYDILNAAAKYEKFVYSNLSGFSVQRDNNQPGYTGGDSTLTVSLDNRVFQNRCNGDLIAFGDGYMATKWEPFGKAKCVQIYSYMVPGNPFHVRIHQIRTDAVLYVYDSGFSVDKTQLRDTEHDSLGKRLVLHASCDTSSCVVRGKGNVRKIEAAPNSNVLFPNTVYPSVMAVIYPGCTTVIHIFGLKKQEESERKAPDVVCCKGKQVQLKMDGRTICVPLHYRINNRMEDLQRIVGIIRIKLRQRLERFGC